MRLGFELAFCCELFRCVLELRREESILCRLVHRWMELRSTLWWRGIELRLNVLVITVHNYYQSIHISHHRTRIYIAGQQC
jgi:hypothetical protein